MVCVLFNKKQLSPLCSKEKLVLLIIEIKNQASGLWPVISPVNNK